MSDDLDGRVALVTGAGSGMGEAIARRFALEGATVVVADVDEPAAERVAGAIHAAGGAAHHIGVDVGDADSVSALADVLRVEHGRLDVLVNNAGILDGFAAVLDTPPELWDRIIRVNLTGMYLVTRAVLPVMLETGGSIVNTSSIAGVVADGGGAAYTASKHGVIGFTRQLASDYGPRGIRANAILPGAVETGMTRSMFADGSAANMSTVNAVPAGRYAQPEEIAALVLFLVGEDASFIHGAAIPIDGGWTVR